MFWMNNLVLQFLIGVGLGFSFVATFTRRLGKGKLTLVLGRKLGWDEWMAGLWRALLIAPLGLLPLMLSLSGQGNSIAHGMAVYFFWVLYTLFHADDCLTGGNNDRWKKRWDRVRNKVKWKWVPAPIPTT
jgi:hypothetical protein